MGLSVTGKNKPSFGEVEARPWKWSKQWRWEREENGAMSGAQEEISSLKSARGEEARVDFFFFLSKKAGEREG